MAPVASGAATIPNQAAVLAAVAMAGSGAAEVGGASGAVLGATCAGDPEEGA